MNAWRLAAAVGGLMVAGAVSGAGGKGAASATPDPAAPLVAPTGVETALAHLYEEVRPGPAGSLAITNGAYRATFSAGEGVIYTPRHAGQFDARLTWRYRARTVSTDTVSRSLDPVAPVVSPTGDHVVDFVRPGLVERYEGERAGVEQIFVLSERPAGRGDVRITGDVTFDGTVRDQDGGLMFEPGGGLPAFGYARPVAFDAERRSMPVRVEAAGGSLTLVLEEAALAHASWPVTIDPLFGSTMVGGEGLGDGIRIAYNWRRGEFLAVYMVLSSTADNYAWVLRARRFYDHGSAVGPSFLVTADGTGLPYGPRVAYDLHTDRYLVVWHRQPSEGFQQVEGMLLDTLAATVAGPFAISATFASVNSTIDVAARNFEEHGAADPSFLVVWAAPSASGSGATLYRERITASGAQFGEVAMGPGMSPAVAFDPHTDRFLVAYGDAAGGAIRARSVSSSGATSAETTVAATSGGCACPSLAYDMASRRFMAAWTETPPAAPPISRARFLASAVTPTPVGSSFVLEQAAAQERLDAVEVAGEVGTFVTLHRRETPSLASVYLKRWRASDGLSLGQTALDGGLVPVSLGGLAFGRHGFLPATFHSLIGGAGFQFRLALYDRWFARGVHGRSGDFDGDGRSDLFLFQQATSLFFVRTQSTTSSYVFAIPGGVPVVLDVDGDDRADLGVWEPSTGKWWIRKSSDGQTTIPVLGGGADIPVPGDYHGEGADRIAVFRPSTATWYIKGFHNSTTTVQFGHPGDLPVPADWNGDGDTELGVWRPSTGMWYAAELDGTPVTIPSTPWGGPGDLPLAGNFTGGPHADQLVYRRQLGVVYRRDGATGATAAITVGHTGLPTPLDWDGDSRLEIAMFHAEAGQWRINDANGTVVTFGTVGDLPAGAP